jgi:hypothetical protein
MIDAVLLSYNLAAAPPGLGLSDATNASADGKDGHQKNGASASSLCSTWLRCAASLLMLSLFSLKRCNAAHSTASPSPWRHRGTSSRRVGSWVSVCAYVRPSSSPYRCRDSINMEESLGERVTRSSVITQKG